MLFSESTPSEVSVSTHKANRKRSQNKGVTIGKTKNGEECATIKMTTETTSTIKQKFVEEWKNNYVIGYTEENYQGKYFEYKQTGTFRFSISKKTNYGGNGYFMSLYIPKGYMVTITRSIINGKERQEIGSYSTSFSIEKTISNFDDSVIDITITETEALRVIMKIQPIYDLSMSIQKSVINLYEKDRAIAVCTKEKEALEISLTKERNLLETYQHDLTNVNTEITNYTIIIRDNQIIIDNKGNGKNEKDIQKKINELEGKINVENTEISKLNSAVVGSEKTITKLNLSITNEETTVTSYNAKLIISKTELSNLQSESKENNNQRNNYLNLIDVSTNNINQLKYQQSELTKEYERIKKEIEINNQKIKSETTKITTNQSLISKIDQTTQLIKSKINKAELDIKNITETITKSNISITNFKIELQNTITLKDKQNIEIKNRSHKVTQMIGERSDLLKQLENNVQKAKQTVSSYTILLNNSHTKVSELNVRISKSQQIIATYISEINTKEVCITSTTRNQIKFKTERDNQMVLLKEKIAEINKLTLNISKENLNLVLTSFNAELTITSYEKELINILTNFLFNLPNNPIQANKALKKIRKMKFK